MAYVSYENLPIYFGGINTATLPGSREATASGVMATQATLNYTPNIAATRLLGEIADKNSFTLAGPPNATLSFTTLLANDGGTAFNPSGFTGDIGDLGATFKIGDPDNGISGSGAFLTSYSYTVAPYAPITIQADFAIYNPLRFDSTRHGGDIASSGIGASPVTPSIEATGLAHGAYSEFNGASLADVDVFESAAYSYQANRLPVYKIGNSCVDKVEFLTAQQSIQIQGDNISAIVPMTGDTPGEIVIELKNQNSDVLLSGNVDGNITAQNIAMSAGNLARGSITVTQPLK